MRYIVTLLIGLFIGALGSITAANALRQGHAYPRGIMTVMKHELMAARDAARDKQCVGTDKPLQMLQLLAPDVEEAIFPTEQADRVFRQYADELSQRIASARAPNLDCSQQTAALTEVSNACEACHRDYR